MREQRSPVASLFQGFADGIGGNPQIGGGFVDRKNAWPRLGFGPSRPEAVAPFSPKLGTGQVPIAATKGSGGIGARIEGVIAHLNGMVNNRILRRIIICSQMF